MALVTSIVRCPECSGEMQKRGDGSFICKDDIIIATPFSDNRQFLNAVENACVAHAKEENRIVTVAKQFRSLGEEAPVQAILLSLARLNKPHIEVYTVNPDEETLHYLRMVQKVSGKKRMKVWMVPEDRWGRRLKTPARYLFIEGKSEIEVLGESPNGTRYGVYYEGGSPHLGDLGPFLQFFRNGLAPAML